MLKWKTANIVISVAGTEILTDILSGQAGKGRKIKYIIGPKTADLAVRLYRDGAQIVDFDTNLFTTGWTLLPVDCSLDIGQLAKAGFKDHAANTGTFKIAIGYEEID